SRPRRLPPRRRPRGKRQTRMATRKVLSTRRHLQRGCATHRSGAAPDRPRMRRMCDPSPAGCSLDDREPGHYRSARFPSAVSSVCRTRDRAQKLEVFDMSRRCDLTGKAAQTGHKVSHSNRKTKRRFLPNLCNVTMISDALGRSVRLRVSANELKSVDHRGGLDAFLIKAKDAELSPRALDLKRQIGKKRAS